MMGSVKEYSLPNLLYGYEALEPIISKEIMTLHHSKHHATYVKNINAALKKLTEQITPSSALVEHVSLLQTIKFNGGGHINHSLFWQNLAPPKSSATKADSAAPKLSAALQKRYGSIDAFKQAFQTLLLAIQGSGWGWLVSDAKNPDHLDIIQTHDQDPVPAQYKPILGIDMWEHAYYLQYQNNKAGYVEKVWEVVNWETLEKRYGGSVREVYTDELWGLNKDHANL
ncbi:superoxide dismutase mitochondrial precursor [Myriangium duriaei CBS 260.36]|uniref:Superoxide dismutase n=1 Tax=Myriangium duriaei CBS 260.36 TaxID=1168546 RepID=A0A9P4IYU0_9PEZI|nr:superoxide dismutase mitochondrial precursor [Myriangium duriaei CBS 260.36]